MFDWIVKLGMSRNIERIVVVVAAIVIIGVLCFTLSRCGRDNHKEEAQAEQSVRSSEAFANAVTNGVEIIDNRAVTESTLAEATVVVKEEIGTAASLSDIQSALVTQLCKQPAHAKDATCIKR